MLRNVCYRKVLLVCIIVLFLLVDIYPISAIDTNKKPVNSLISNGKTLYVGGSGPGNYSKIQDAIDNASDGDTVFVFNGTYYVRVDSLTGLVVDKSITLIGEDKNNTTINGSGCWSIIEITANNTIISRFTVRDGNFGIYGREIKNVNISMMNITQTSRGIILQKLDLKSSFYIIKNCVFKGNRRALDLDGNNNIISENIFENPEYSGIWMISDYSIITNNTFINYNSKYLKDHIRLD